MKSKGLEELKKTIDVEEEKLRILERKLYDKEKATIDDHRKLEALKYYKEMYREMKELIEKVEERI